MRTQNVVRATFVALMFTLAGCAGIGLQSPIVFNKSAPPAPTAPAPATPSAPASKPAPAAVDPAPAPAVKPAEAPVVPQFIKEPYVMRVDKVEQILTTFPKAKVTAATKWLVAHKDGFTGSFDDACTLLGLTESQCVNYKKMHRDGKCVVVAADVSTVLDSLTFTKESGHRVQKNVSVQVGDVEHRKAAVCHLGDGVYVGRFNFCSNHFRVNGDPLKVVDKNVVGERDVPNPAYVAPSGAPAKTAEFCGGSPNRTITVMVWDPKGFTPELTSRFAQVQDAAKSTDSHFRGDLFSRAMGGPLRKSGIPKASSADGTVVKVYTMTPGQEVEPGQLGEYFGHMTIANGEGSISIPAVVGKSNVLRFEFPEQGFSSPRKSRFTGRQDINVFPADDRNKPNELWVDKFCTPKVHAAVVAK